MINIGVLSLDIIIVVFLFLVLFFSALKFGKKFLIVLILSVYPALLIFNNLSYLQVEEGSPEAIAFIVIYIFMVGILWKNVSSKKLITTFRKVFDYGALSLAFMALIISISSHSVTSLQYLYTFSGFLPDLINQIDLGLVLVIPMILLLLTNKKDTE